MKHTANHGNIEIFAKFVEAINILNLEIDIGEILGQLIGSLDRQWCRLDSQNVRRAIIQ